MLCAMYSWLQNLKFASSECISQLCCFISLNIVLSAVKIMLLSTQDPMC